MTRTRITCPNAGKGIYLRKKTDPRIIIDTRVAMPTDPLEAVRMTEALWSCIAAEAITTKETALHLLNIKPWDFATSSSSGGCPLCKIWMGFTCTGCPLALPKEPGLGVPCHYKNAPYNTWSKSRKIENKVEAAHEIVRRCREWIRDNYHLYRRRAKR